MIHIETIDLTSRGIILPTDKVGMVVAQPCLRLTDTEPYQCTQAARAAELANLSKTLAVALTAPHGAPKTHFTIFPEYSIPGLEGIALVDAALADPAWPTGTIVIGGTDALSKDAFTSLTVAPNTHWDAHHNALARLTANEWVNCGITWIKTDNGTVERWLQPKLSPAWPEQDVTYQDMFQGRSVYTFKGRLEGGAFYRFSTLVCFDWIAKLGTQKAWQWVVDGLKQQAEQAQADEVSLSWFFVIQCNSKPSHDSFLTEVADFFDQTTFPTVRRERACLVFANSAGSARPGRVNTYGSTSLVFSGQTLFRKPTCHATFSNGGVRFRSSTLLSPYLDVVFREGGACIHCFCQVNPGSLNVGAAGSTIAIANASVFPLDGTDDPRVPSASVPACVKWLNDELDALPSLSAQYPIVALAGQADVVHRGNILALRQVSAQSAGHIVKLAATDSKVALPNGSAKPKNADEWETSEAQAVEHVVHTLDIVGLGYPDVVVGVDPAHATVIIDSRRVDVLAIRGKTHQACIEHSKTFLPFPRRQTLLVSRDTDNTGWRKKFGSFLQTEVQQVGQDRSFVDPQGGLLHVGYEKMLEIFRTSPTTADVQGAIYAELAA